MESGGMNCLKYLLFVFNLLFFLGGAGLLGVGIWVAVSAESFRNIVISNPVIFNGVYIIIAVGAALFVIGFLGCCGAIKENKCLLGTFFFVVLVIFIIEIVGAILLFVNYGKVEAIALESMLQYGKNSTTDEQLITQGWDTFQSTVACCGYNNHTDWQKNGATFPTSCCKRDILTTDGKILNQTLCIAENDDYLNKIGCESKLRNYIWVSGGVGLGILAVELLGMIFACCLYKAIED